MRILPLAQSKRSSVECDLSEWCIESHKREQLLTILAYLYLQQEMNAQRVVAALDPRARSSTKRALPNAINKLTAPKPGDLELMEHGNEEEREKAKNSIKVSIEHRDGHLFQYLSWVAARLASPTSILTPPHVRQADKGFDGFIIDLDDAQKKVMRVVLCEDKASQAPRNLITSSVWKEISSICEGDREDEVHSSLNTLLKAVPGLSEEELEDAVDTIFWEKIRHFRVSVATGEDQRGKSDFAQLFSGFEDVALGALESRIGGILPFTDVRTGLAELAEDVITKLQEIGSATGDSVV
ncbi:hypothetical protein [Paracoccus sp. (in: a-proteobacteria)]|uniref:hypothetical protein n=1 Tax=Paracoccus sp. TaxID=267 RepID=UPI0040598DF2